MKLGSFGVDDFDRYRSRTSQHLQSATNASPPKSRGQVPRGYSTADDQSQSDPGYYNIFDAALFNQHLEKELIDTREQLKIANEDCEDLRRELQEIAAPSHLQADVGEKVDDDFIAGLWRRLRWDIKNWSNTHFTGESKSPWFKAPRSIPLQFNSLTPDCEAYLRSARLRPLLIQAFIWLRLQELVFSFLSETGPCWAGPWQHSLKDLHRAFKPHGISDVHNRALATAVKSSDWMEYHAWRSLTSRLLQMRVGDQKKDEIAQALSKKIRNELQSFATSSASSLDSGLVRIVRQAIELDAVFHKQRSFFRTFREPREQRANTDFAERHDDAALPCELARVKMVVAPGLSKLGSAEGDFYDRETVIVKCAIFTEEVMLRRDHSMQSVHRGRPSTARAPSQDIQRTPSKRNQPPSRTASTEKSSLKIIDTSTWFRKKFRYQL